MKSRNLHQNLGVCAFLTLSVAASCSDRKEGKTDQSRAQSVAGQDGTPSLVQTVEEATGISESMVHNANMPALAQLLSDIAAYQRYLLESAETRNLGELVSGVDGRAIADNWSRSAADLEAPDDIPAGQYRFDTLTMAGQRLTKLLVCATSIDGRSAPSASGSSAIVRRKSYHAINYMEFFYEDGVSRQIGIAPLKNSVINAGEQNGLITYCKSMTFDANDQITFLKLGYQSGYGESTFLSSFYLKLYMPEFERAVGSDGSPTSVARTAYEKDFIVGDGEGETWQVRGEDQQAFAGVFGTFILNDQSTGVFSEQSDGTFKEIIDKNPRIASLGGILGRGAPTVESLRQTAEERDLVLDHFRAFHSWLTTVTGNKDDQRSAVQLGRWLDSNSGKASAGELTQAFRVLLSRYWIVDSIERFIDSLETDTSAQMQTRRSYFQRLIGPSYQRRNARVVVNFESTTGFDVYRDFYAVGGSSSMANLTLTARHNGHCDPSTKYAGQGLRFCTDTARESYITYQGEIAVAMGRAAKLALGPWQQFTIKADFVGLSKLWEPTINNDIRAAIVEPTPASGSSTAQTTPNLNAYNRVSAAMATYLTTQNSMNSVITSTGSSVMANSVSRTATSSIQTILAPLFPLYDSNSN